LWDELANYDQLPTCKCEGCTCDLGSILDKKQEEERVHTFLMGLDDTVYDIVCSNILPHDPLPNLNKVYSILIQEERVQTMAYEKEDRGEVMTFVVCGRMDGKDKTMICSHCKRSGHDANSCFALIGYPEWWGDRLNTDGKNGGHGRGSQSSLQRTEKGVDQGRGVVWFNAAQAIPESSTIGSTSDGNDMKSLRLSHDQLPALMKLLKDQNNYLTEKMTDGNNIVATKALGKQQYSFLLRKLGIQDLHAPT